MPSMDFIQPQIFVDDQPLVEYPDPDGDDQDVSDITRYVEVKAGQKFKVQVTLLPGFQLLGAPLVYTAIRIDQDETLLYHVLDCSEMHGGAVRQPKMSCFETVKFKDDNTGNWVFAKPEFGALGLGEDIPLPETFRLSKIDHLGSIRVTVYRAHRRKLVVPRVWNGKLEKPLDQIAEKALKGRSVKNNVKYISESVTEAQEPILYDYIPILGEGGRIYTFKFLYRNKRILQHLGCLPRSPSPPPDPALMLRRTEEMLQNMKQEARERNLQIMELQERLARAERVRHSSVAIDLESEPNTPAGSRAASIRAEARERETNDIRRSAPITFDGRLSIPPPPVFTNIKRERSPSQDNILAANGKRTREQAMLDDGDDLCEMAPAPAKRKVEIDLTDLDESD